MEIADCSTRPLQVGVRPISCDQVAWLLDIFDRYLPPSSHPRVSQERDMLKYGMLYEVMDVAGLSFEDDAARWNGTPNRARKYDEKGKCTDEKMCVPCFVGKGPCESA